MVRLLVLAEKMRLNATQDVEEILRISVVATSIMDIIALTQNHCQYLAQGCEFVFITNIFTSIKIL